MIVNCQRLETTPLPFSGVYARPSNFGWVRARIVDSLRRFLRSGLRGRIASGDQNLRTNLQHTTPFSRRHSRKLVPRQAKNPFNYGQLGASPLPHSLHSSFNPQALPHGWPAAGLETRRQTLATRAPLDRLLLLEVSRKGRCTADAVGGRPRRSSGARGARAGAGGACRASRHRCSTQ